MPSNRFGIFVKFHKNGRFEPVSHSECELATEIMSLEYKRHSSTFSLCLRPYYVENTGSRPITEVKQRRAWLVLGWVTAWEYQVL